MAVIFLIGARGAGKSTVGALLAEQLGGEFRDLDEELCRGAGDAADAGSLFATRGERAFRELESKALAALVAELADKAQTVVVATGGGVVEEASNHALLGQGRCIWLEATPEELARRVSEDETPRPPLSATDTTPLEEAQRILKRRRPLYSALADERRDTTLATPMQLAKALAASIKGNDEGGGSESGRGENSGTTVSVLIGFLFSLAASPAAPGAASPSVMSASVPPASVKPASVKPAFVKPASVTPAFVKPAFVTPAFVTPAFVKPAFVTPAFVTPAFVTPASVTPAAQSTVEAETPVDDVRRVERQDAYISSYRELAAAVPEDLAATHARLRGADADQGMESDSLEVDRALVLVAGRGTPPGLSAARSAERERLRAAGLAVIATGLSGASGANGERSRWLSCLHSCLEGGRDEPQLWLAAAGAVGELEVEDMAGFVARGLSHPAATPLGLGARRALHGLYHRWFSGPDDYAAFRAALDRPVGGTLYREPLIASEARAFERLERILDLRPAQATAWIADPNPAVRAAALAALARGVGRGEVPAQTALAILTQRSAVEGDPAAFHAAVDTLQKLLTGAAPEAAPIVTLRGHLDSVLRSGDTARFGTVAVVLSRLPWAAAQPDTANTDTANTDAANTDAANTDAPNTDTANTNAPNTDAPNTDAPNTDAQTGHAAGTDETSADAPTPGISFAWGLARLTWLVRKQGDPNRAWDGDALAQSLGALDALCRRSLVEAGELPVALLTEPVRERVFDLLADEGAPTSVRLAAAGAAAHLALSGDRGAGDEPDASGVRRLTAVLDTATTGTPVRYALLGTLAQLAQGALAVGDGASGPIGTSESARPAAGAEATARQLILKAFIAHLARPEVELRARALELLAAPELAAYARAAGAELYLARLAVEPSREMRGHLLDLLARFRRPDLVGKLLASPAAAALAAEDARGVRRLASTLAILAASDSRALTQSARAVVAFPGPRTRIPRWEEALALVAAIPTDEAAQLSGEHHRAFVGWALELRAARGSQPLPPAFLGSLVDVHLALALELERDLALDLEREQGEPAALAHGAALLLGDRVLAAANSPGRTLAPTTRPVAHDPAEALDWYARALAAADGPGPGAGPGPGPGAGAAPPDGAASPARAAILRDRARYYSGLGDDAGARGDFRAILSAAQAAAARSEPGPSPDGPLAAVLDLSDLRRAAALLAQAGDDGASSAAPAAATGDHPERAPGDESTSANGAPGTDAAEPSRDSLADPDQAAHEPSAAADLNQPPPPAQAAQTQPAQATTDRSLAVFALLLLVERPAWIDEPLAVRLKDLALLVEYALNADDHQLSRVQGLFKSALAPVQPTQQATPPAHPWQALLDDSASTATLHNIAARLPRLPPGPAAPPADNN